MALWSLITLHTTHPSLLPTPRCSLCSPPAHLVFKNKDGEAEPHEGTPSTRLLSLGSLEQPRTSDLEVLRFPGVHEALDWTSSTQAPQKAFLSLPSQWPPLSRTKFHRVIM